MDARRSSARVQKAGADRKAHAARLCQALDDRTAVWCVVGLGTIGRLLMSSLMAAGFEVHGYDRSVEAVERFGEPPARPARPWSVGTGDAVLDAADVVLVAVRVPVLPDRTADLEPLATAARALRRLAREPRLVLLESTVPPGTTRLFAEQWLEAASQPGLFVAHAPERLQSGPSPWTLDNTPHLVGGLDDTATAVAARALGAICRTVVPVSAPEVCELSKLLENGFLVTGIALVGEITRLAHRLGIAAAEVTRAAATKPFGYVPFHPGPGIGGHCLPNDVELLRTCLRERDLPSPLLDGAIDVAARLPAMVVDRLEEALRAHGRNLAGSRILLVGVGFKIGAADATASPAVPIVRLLRQRGADPAYLDHQVPALEVDGRPTRQVPPRALPAARFDACLILSGDETVSADQLEAAAAVLLDAGGGRIVRGAFSRAIHL